MPGGATRGVMGREYIGMGLADVYARRCFWVEVQIDIPIQIGSGDGWGGIREFKHDANGLAFLRNAYLSANTQTSSTR